MISPTLINNILVTGLVFAGMIGGIAGMGMTFVAFCYAYPAGMALTVAVKGLVDEFDR